EVGLSRAPSGCSAVFPSVPSTSWSDAGPGEVLSDAVTGLTQTSRFTRSRTRRWRWRRTRVWLLVYCGVICAVALRAFSERAPSPVMGSRAGDVAASIAVLDRGGPPLLASDVPYRPGLDVSHLRPVGVTDDQGIYLYLPALAEFTGEHNPAVLMK